MTGSMRRRVPWWVLALLFVVLPVVEIYVLIQIGQTIGAWWTVLLLVADGVLGSWLMKREGTRAWRALREAIDSRRMPAKELEDILTERLELLRGGAIGPAHLHRPSKKKAKTA